jgi:hypothetical protein
VKALIDYEPSATTTFTALHFVISVTLAGKLSAQIASMNMGMILPEAPRNNITLTDKATV